ncbi:hypothetical protein BDC45DRAFT_522624 [Circinella umbellata]|nr:hypothetical protein BDC45DRAFT_522624 [Circinella umbellata]
MTDDDDDESGRNNITSSYSSSLGQIASVAQSQQQQQQLSAARVRRSRRRRTRSNGGSFSNSSESNNNHTSTNDGLTGSGDVVGGTPSLRRQRGFYQLETPPWALRTNRSRFSIAGDNNNNNNNEDNNIRNRQEISLLPHSTHDYNLRQEGSNSNRDPRLLRRARSRLNSPWVRHHQHHYYNQQQNSRRSSSSSSNSNNYYCIGERAIDLSSYNKKSEQRSVSDHQLLDFDIVMDDGGQYRYEDDDGEDDNGSSMFGVENILQNDDSVYCSGRSGSINILMQYCGSAMNNPLMNDKSCVISQIIIKSPQRGFTAPCKEGLFFISYNPIDVDSTAKFDNYTKSDYERYVRSKGGHDRLDDSDPVGWFSMSSDRQDIVHINDRVGKYVLVKLLRAEKRIEGESENIDLQYVAIIGYSGARAFASARLC